MVVRVGSWYLRSMAGTIFWAVVALSAWNLPAEVRAGLLVRAVGFLVQYGPALATLVLGLVPLAVVTLPIRVSIEGALRLLRVAVRTVLIVIAALLPIPPLPGLFHFVLWESLLGLAEFRRWTSRPRTTGLACVSPDPIESFSGDLMNRTAEARTVAEVIRGLAPRERLSMAVLGKWGTGKTSFLNLVAEHLTKTPGVQVIRFNPWLYRNHESMVRAYLGALGNLLRRTGSYLGWYFLLEAYGRTLAEVVEAVPVMKANGSVLSKLITAVVPRDPELSRLKGAVARALDKALGGQKLVVLVDDLDRCSPDQIVTALGFFMEMVNFEGCSFLFALDWDQVVRALEKEVGQGMGGQFLAKFIHQRVILPAISVSAYVEAFIRRHNCAEGLRSGLRACLELLPESPRELNLILRQVMDLPPVFSSMLEDDFSHFHLILAVILQQTNPQLFSLLGDPARLREVKNLFTRWRMLQAGASGEVSPESLRGRVEALLGLRVDEKAFEATRQLVGDLAMDPHILDAYFRPSPPKEFISPPVFRRCLRDLEGSASGPLPEEVAAGCRLLSLLEAFTGFVNGEAVRFRTSLTPYKTRWTPPYVAEILDRLIERFRQSSLDPATVELGRALFELNSLLLGDQSVQRVVERLIFGIDATPWEVAKCLVAREEDFALDPGLSAETLKWVTRLRRDLFARERSSILRRFARTRVVKELVLYYPEVFGELVTYLELAGLARENRDNSLFLENFRDFVVELCGTPSLRDKARSLGPQVPARLRQSAEELNLNPTWARRLLEMIDGAFNGE